MDVKESMLLTQHSRELFSWIPQAWSKPTLRTLNWTAGTPVTISPLAPPALPQHTAESSALIPHTLASPAARDLKITPAGTLLTTPLLSSPQHLASPAVVRAHENMLPRARAFHWKPAGTWVWPRTVIRSAAVLAPQHLTVESEARPQE